MTYKHNITANVACGQCTEAGDVILENGSIVCLAHLPKGATWNESQVNDVDWKKLYGSVLNILHREWSKPHGILKAAGVAYAAGIIPSTLRKRAEQGSPDMRPHEVKAILARLRALVAEIELAAGD